MPGETIPTIRLKHKETGRIITVNALDYANGNVPGANMNADFSMYDRVGETHGDGEAADIEAENQRLAALKLKAEAEAKEKEAAAKAKNDADAALAQKAKLEAAAAKK